MDHILVHSYARAGLRMRRLLDGAAGCDGCQRAAAAPTDSANKNNDISTVTTTTQTFWSSSFATWCSPTAMEQDLAQPKEQGLVIASSPTEH
jgi:hypothetical protein